MKLTYKNERGLEFVAKNPDESLSNYWRTQIEDAIWSELREFSQECAVALRNLKPGEKVTLESRPVKVTIQKSMEEAGGGGK